VSIEHDTDEGALLEGVEQLVAWFRAGEKSAAAFRVGLEHEKLLYRRGSLEPTDYPQVRQILLDLRRFAWEPRPNAEEPVALERAGAWVSLEPGGQLELSGPPYRSVHESAALMRSHADELRAVCEPLGVGIADLGFRPFVEARRVPRTPRRRHAIMRDYLPRRGRRALDMMCLTASVQANFDYASEPDLVRKLRCALRLSPVVAAIFANSPIRGSTASGLRSTRVATWFDVDPDRCGLLPFAFDAGMDYRRYAEWILDVPMMFMRRKGEYRPLPGISLRRFAAEGFQGESARIADFETQLSMVFPEVRCKRWLEVRSADASGVDGALALGALWKGVLYDDEALSRAEALTRELSPGDLESLQRSAARDGLQGRVGEHALGAWANEVLELARVGLQRQGVLDEAGRDESIYLRPIADVVAQGRTLADRLLEHFGRGPYDEAARRAILATAGFGGTDG